MINKILQQVKANKKYKTIADSVVKTEINVYLKSHQIKMNKENSNQINKQDIKNIRAKLHQNYASFQTKKKRKREIYLENLDMKKLLSITLSTKERENNYNKIYKQISEIAGKPKTIVDLGCGLNPVSYPILNKVIKSKPAYHCYDIDTEDIKFLNKFFKKFNINGKASILDLRDTKKLSQIPSSDIIFLFKVIDILDKNKKNHKKSEELIKILIKKTKFIIASFATQTITRKKMNYPNRKWFELMLERNDLKFKTIKTHNEIFYLISLN